MTTTELKIGDTVNIYDDPVTCLKFEGRAIVRKIVQPFSVAGDGIRCEVEFADEPGTNYSRLIFFPLGRDEN
jgi:hypothetical protein